MKKRKKSILVPTVMAAFICTGLFLPGLVVAGDLDPGAAPAPTMRTLDEIYHKVENIVPSTVVEKTGQTTSYATGDDGDLEKGVAWPDPRFTDNLDGTVKDNLTGLIWLQNASCFGEKAWAVALSDCNTLSSPDCGLTDGSIAGDWRLPNIKELYSLIDFGMRDPALPSGHPFTGVVSNDYWSSTTVYYYVKSSYRVEFNQGQRNGAATKDVSQYVWPVRGGQ